MLDEADRMADDGFTPQVEWILRHCTGPQPDDAVLGDARRRRRPPHPALPEGSRSRSPSTRPTDTVGTMHHLFLAVHHMDKAPGRRVDRPGHRRRSPCSARRSGCATRSPPRSTSSASTPQAIHGDLPQVARERALRKFAEGKLAVLVATDVAARGLDIDDIGAVIHYDPPKDAKDYLHRSGRTARAGRDGWAVTLVEYNQHTQMRILQRTLRLPLTPPIEVFSNDVRLRDLADVRARPGRRDAALVYESADAVDAGAERSRRRAALGVDRRSSRWPACSGGDDSTDGTLGVDHAPARRRPDRRRPVDRARTAPAGTAPSIRRRRLRASSQIDVQVGGDRQSPRRCSLDRARPCRGRRSTR